MSCYRTVRLFCDARSEPTDLLPHGVPCNTEFHAQEAGFEPSITAVRKLAAKSGWTYIPYPTRDRRVKAVLDKDYCPACKPAATWRPTMPEAQPSGGECAS